MKPFHFLPVLTFALASAVSAAPLVVKDEEVLRTMREKLGELAAKKRAVSGKWIGEALRKAPRQAVVDLPADVPKPNGYRDLVKSVFVVGSAYKCDQCPEWHNGTIATAWALTEDGVMVSNRHVFQEPQDDSWGVRGVDGKVYRITAILASDPVTDAVLFKVDTTGDKLTPLKLGGDGEVGDRVRIVSHPGDHFYFQSSGEISRYSRDRALDDNGESTWMCVTAEFAQGSSGGPVISAEGTVVGMVSNVQSINYEPEEPAPAPKTAAKTPPQRGKVPAAIPVEEEPAYEDFREQQMVVKNCVPVSDVLQLITPKKVELAGPPAP